MIIDTDLLRFCALKVREVEEWYRKSYEWAMEFPRSADELFLLVHERYEKPVYRKRLNRNQKGRRIKAIYRHRVDGFYVYLLDGHDVPHQRYYLAKEVFQIILDQEAMRTRDIEDLITNMMRRARPDSIDANLGSATVSERLAEIAAQEFLFPYSERARHKAQADLKDGYSQLAKDYGIPQYLIEGCLTDGWMTTMGKFFS